MDTEPDYLRSLDPPPDVILADYSLPQFNAMRALALLQERGLDIPFIIVTGTIGEEMAVATIQQGAADYLLKDRLTRLGSAVARALEQKRLRLEKQEADQALRDREKRFRALIENSADAISLLDAQGIILYTSPAATRILGYPAEELAGRNASELIHPGDKAYARNLFAQLVQAPGASVTGLYRNCHKDGSWRWIEGTATNLLADPSVQAIVANYRDVTERKQREREREAIIAVATALRAAPTRTAMLPVLLDQLLNLLQVRGAAVAMRDPITGGIVIELGRGEWARATHTHLPPHEGISAQVMATRQPYVSSDIRSDERFTWPDLLGTTNAVACVPLIAQEQAIGVLGVGGDTPLGEAEVRLLMAVADMAANAIHRASLHEQTEQS
ncbi:MAG: PAS domain S-box protein, partial [Anaerolineales bacterium]